MFFGGCYVQEVQAGKIIRHDFELGGLYDVIEVDQDGYAIFTNVVKKLKIRMWHKRLGHPSLG